eukprot:7982852-Lingulodinium_polyedra.AAC.1
MRSGPGQRRSIRRSSIASWAGPESRQRTCSEWPPPRSTSWSQVSSSCFSFSGISLRGARRPWQH